jgi:hypothetical protein
MLLGSPYRQVLQADGLRITLQRWTHVGKVVYLVLIKGGKLPRPCGAAFMGVMMNFVVEPKCPRFISRCGGAHAELSARRRRNTCQAKRQREFALVWTLDAVY